MVKDKDIDYLTFSGRGEPTLAKNLGEMIQRIKEVREEEIAVITNSTTLYLSHVREDLVFSDLVIAKLDACDEMSFFNLDKPMKGIRFERIMEGIKKFRDVYQGRLSLQIMFVEENRRLAKDMASLVRAINADEIQINTPLRPSAAKALDKEGIDEIRSYFEGMPAVTVYDHDRKETVPSDAAATARRHGHPPSQETTCSAYGGLPRKVERDSASTVS